jgi:hypothetical protein
MGRVLTYIAATMLAVACVAVASAIAASNFDGSRAAYVTRSDFDEAFAAASLGRRDGAMGVNRDLKGDRLTLSAADTLSLVPSANALTIVRKNAMSPPPARDATDRQAPQGAGTANRKATSARLDHCEPVASPFADPNLGRIIGRCMV